MLWMLVLVYRLTQMDTSRARLRPYVSPIFPMMMPPRGRIAKPSPKMVYDRRSLRGGFGGLRVMEGVV